MITLVPISHVADESIAVVKKAIRELKPDYVAIEIGPERVKALQGEEGRKMRLFDKRVLVGFILSMAQNRYARKAGNEAGKEMKIAMEEAKKVGAKILPIDRPISITLSRVSDALSLKDLLRLTWMAIKGEDVPFDINSVPERKLVDELVKELKEKFPKLYKVLITERDDYMAKRLLKKRNVVAVVGAGHIEGLVKRLEEVQVFEKRDL